MRNKKTWAFVLVLCMLVSMLGACTSATTPGVTTPAASKEATSAPAASPKTLTVGIASEGRGEALPEQGNEYIDDNWSTNYIKENWAKKNNIDLKYVIVDNTGGAYLQNYQLMLASKTAPDLFSISVGEGAAFVKKMALDGGLADLTASIAQYGPNIAKVLGAGWLEKYGTLNNDGKVYTIPGLEPIPAISHYFIRTDWLEALGLKMPENFDEWYATMKAFKDRASELEAKGRVKSANDVIPYAMYHTRWFTPWERIVTRFYPSSTFDEKNQAYYMSGYGIEYNKEGFKEGLQFMNTMYSEGLITRNFALDVDQKQYERDISSGNAGSYCNNLFTGWKPSDPASLMNVAAKNIPGAKFEWCNTFTNKYDNVKRNPLDDVVLNWQVIPSFSKAVDEAIQYLNFTNEEKNLVNIDYGVEGTSYDMVPELGPIMKTPEVLKANGFQHRLAGGELNMICRLTNPSWSIIRRSNAVNQAEATYALKIYNGIVDNGYSRFPIQLRMVPEKAEFEGTLMDPWQKFLADCIMAKPADYEKTYADGVKNLESNNSTKILDGIKKYWDSTIKTEVGGK